MATIKTVDSDRINVAGRAGELIVQRKNWPVATVVAADLVVIGYLPAGHRIHAQASQLRIEAAVPNCDIDLVLLDGDDVRVLHNTGSHTTGSVTRVALTTYDLVETIGTSSENRALALLINTAPATFVGEIKVDLAYFAP